MLVSMAQILNAAREGGYGVTAPNIHNEDTARAAISAAVENRAPMTWATLQTVTSISLAIW